MKTKFKTIFALAVLAGPISAVNAGIILPIFPPPDQHHCGLFAHSCTSAPEIDPASAMGAFALLGGTVAILRGRRKK
jgi:hypothetical protein